ncbi:MAG TPA: 1,4-alpha-glucan branching enzyme [Lachnospiraceae bacterium]|nr:1,4-alpha-glucan branching enzyme [Lachnospiraceae bacterium]
MKDKAYDYMDWPGIEGILYSDEKNPKKVLSPRQVKEGVIYQCFVPGAKKAVLKLKETNREYPMQAEDAAGYFACLVPGKKVLPHTFIVDEAETGDPYAFANQITQEEESRFDAGICYDIYKKLGAHPEEIDGEKGIFFALWAPNAIRASVVGDFNSWDGRRYPMEYHEDSGIYELFIPELTAGIKYKFEMKLATGLTYTRPDPYGNQFLPEENCASCAADLSYHWHDRPYLTERRKNTDFSDKPMSIFECSLSAFGTFSEGEVRDYRTLADKITAYASEMGYTHIELMPVMEYPDEKSNGYQTAGYFAPTSRFGKPADFKYFIDHAHMAGLGVLLDWTPAQFSSDPDWLAFFDGTCLYEHLDPRQGIHPMWGSRLYNYGRPQVRNFLISNAIFWMKEYHADGLRMDGCSSMLRLDYGRANGEWIPNIYGSYENLDGIEFLKHLNSVFKKNFPEGILIMEEDVDWPDTTGALDDGHLGFDFKWNLHFTQDMLHYLSMTPEERVKSHEILMLGMLHHYLEHYIISLSRGIGMFDGEKLRADVYGSKPEKDASLRCAYAYLFAHPGKKLLTDRETFSDGFFSVLLGLYKNEKAFYELDYDESGFEWINMTDDVNCVLTFMRKAGDPKDIIIAACNFSEKKFDRYCIGVPFEGKYKEIFNTDGAGYGGSGFVNPRARISAKQECDERENSIAIRLAPLSVSFFKYQH